MALCCCSCGHFGRPSVCWNYWALLLGRLDEKEEQMQQSFARLSEQLGEGKAKGILAGVLVAMIGFKLVLPAAMNQI